MQNPVFAQKAKSAEQPKKDSLTAVKVWGLSAILPGSGQFINKQYYKIPIFYAGIAGFGYIGYKSNKLYKETYNRYKIATTDPTNFSTFNGDFNNIGGRLPDVNNLNDLQNHYIRYKQYRNISYGAASAIYLLSIADAVVNFKDNQEHSPTKATILSTIFPGLGQVYNGKYWKVPILYGGFTAFGYAISFTGSEYKRYKTAYNYATDNDPNTVDEFNGKRSPDQLKSVRDYYRRNRDYAIIGCAALYVLNIIDANVDASLYDYEIDDNLSVKIEPTFVNDGYWVAQQSTPFAPGMKLTFKF